MLRPIDNAVREARRLDGIWDFSLDGALENTRPMPVPASYNDIYPDAALRDHVGDVWYRTRVAIPASWDGSRIALRFDAATHRATVWLDDTEVGAHDGGYIPFEIDITALARAGTSHRLTVRVNNELHWHTIPPGQIVTRRDGRRVQQVFHDFFNYAGLHRSVWLVRTPRAGIADIAVTPGWSDGVGTLDYRVLLRGIAECSVALLDAGGRAVAHAASAEGRLSVPDATPWQPGAAYLYRLRVTAGTDVYDLPVGLRGVRVEGNRLLINGTPFHFRGFGMHEDSAIRGKGHDTALMVHDFALLDWIGANSFRTSHYPYAEEWLDYADRHGIVVISETEAVGLNTSLGLARDMVVPSRLYGQGAVSDQTQQAHLRAIRELIARDSRHPSVVMWSLANEPDVRPDGAREYFEPLIAEAKRLDPSRPVTVVNVQFCGPEQDCIAELLDVLCLNRYYGWYWNGGDLAEAEAALREELAVWARKYDKPIVITEYGADTMPGLHATVPSMWTEEYQTAVLEMCHRVFDGIPSIVGEHVWNFADFATSQGVMRVGGNRKGVFTRDRQPKTAAHTLRARWRGKT